ncbi:MAG TPA: hypothetical protein VHF27_06435 [Acidimicrobiales bacterium]|nr:hypothetical protein [Acidimicrobiales bacterium]
MIDGASPTRPTGSARVAGSTRGAAQEALATAAPVGRETPTGAALAAGELSIGQAHEISRTDAVNPGSERDLLALALESSLAKLQDEGRRRRLKDADPDELYRRQRRAREFRHWRDPTA